MTENNEAAQGSEWLLEPPEPGEIKINIAIGDDVELSPETRQELESLMRTIDEAEVAGFAAGTDSGCPSLDDCSWYSCSLRRCVPLTRAPCAWNVECKVKPRPTTTTLM